LELARSPQEADVRAAVEGAVRELAEGVEGDRQDLRRKVAEALRAFWASDLGRRVAQARRVLRELPMLLAVDGVEIAAAVDLLFEDAQGRWELVDYKSGSPDAGRAAQAASAFRLQLGLYALAASRWLDRPIGRWSVYFLGSAVTHSHDVAGADLEEAEALAKRALSGLAAGQFEPRRGRACSACPLRHLCVSR
jgi:ATP-dependent exoDNAse (exonuclease V) beta subunit